MTQTKTPTVYFSFFAFAPLTFAVPRRVFCLFLRCLPASQSHVSPPPTNPRHSEKRTLLSAGTLDLAGKADADQSVVRLELLHGLGGVVDKGEAGGLATTELGAETKDIDLVLGSLVEGSELLAEVLLGDVGTAGVEDVTAEQKPVSQRAPRISIVPSHRPNCCRSIPPPTRRFAIGFEIHRDNVFASGRFAVVGRRRTGRLSREESGKNSHDHLLTAEQRVANELARAQGDGGVGVSHLRGWRCCLAELTIKTSVVEMVGFSCGWVIFWQAARLGGGARKFRSRDELGASPNENLCLSTDHNRNRFPCGPSFAAPSPTFAPQLAAPSVLFTSTACCSFHS